MGLTVCEHCKNAPTLALIDHNQYGKCLATFDSESKSYEKGYGYNLADEFDQIFADDIINADK